MAGWKNRLSKYFRDKLGLTALEYQVNEQLDFQMSFLNFTAAEVLKIPDNLLPDIVANLHKRHGQINFATAIHKNDIMFQHHLYHHPDIGEALKHYFRVGAGISEEMAQIFSLPEGTKLLDFGAGYGRLTRFLPAFFPKIQVIVSEVKPLCVSFLQEYMGLPGFIHSADPISFPDKRFHGILALSVFTHLPEALFTVWLATLANHLEPDGKLVLSFNNSGLKPGLEGKDFHYTFQSEDSFFRTSDRLARQEEYGLTFVSERYLSDQADLLGLVIEFQKSASLGSQQLAIVQQA